MECFIREQLKDAIIVPNPMLFLNIFIHGLTDITPELREWVKIASAYILELGLMDETLSCFHMGMRCAAILHLLRFILRQCGGGITDVKNPTIRPYQLFPLWTKTLEKLTSYDIEALRYASMAYGQMLIKINDSNAKPYLQRDENAKFNVCSFLNLKKLINLG